MIRAILLVIVLLIVGVAAISREDARDGPRIERAAAISEGTAKVRIAEADAIFAEWQSAKSKDGIDPDRLKGLRIRLLQIDVGAADYEAATARVAQIDAIEPAATALWEKGAPARAKREQAKREKDKLAARKAYPGILETRMLKQGMDFYVSVEGPDATVLRVKYVLMSRPFVYKLGNETDFLRNCRELGFKKVFLTDGYNGSWSYDL